jgi:hypothetical protein
VPSPPIYERFVSTLSSLIQVSTAFSLRSVPEILANLPTSLPQETVSTSQQEYEKWSADRQAQNLKHLRMLHKVATAVPPKARQKATTVPLVARQEAAAVPLRGIPRAMANQIPSTNPYAYPHDSSLSPNTTALLIIDMQRDFLSPGGVSPVQYHQPPIPIRYSNSNSIATH